MLTVAKFGGGVNTWALLVLLRNKGIVPDAIVMADPGDEWSETEAYRDGVGAAWLELNGFPSVQVITRASEAAFRPRARKVEPLFAECERLVSPPSVAYPQSKRCSNQYKAAVSFWWLQRWPAAVLAREQGERIRVAIGYDAGEAGRVEGRSEFTDPAEREWSFPWYPLFDDEIDREGCVSIIRAEGLPIPPKSACMRCPNNKVDDWYRLYSQRPEIFEKAVELSRRAAKAGTFINPAVAGFLRGFAPAGFRQLHEWVDGLYGTDMPPPPHKQVDYPAWKSGRKARRRGALPLAPVEEVETPCECAL